MRSDWRAAHLPSSIIEDFPGCWPAQWSVLPQPLHQGVSPCRLPAPARPPATVPQPPSFPTSPQLQGQVEREKAGFLWSGELCGAFVWRSQGWDVDRTLMMAHTYRPPLSLSRPSPLPVLHSAQPSAHQAAIRLLKSPPPTIHLCQVHQYTLQICPVS